MPSNTFRATRGIVAPIVLAAAVWLAVTPMAWASPADYQQGTSYFFTTPSGQWHCAIVAGDGPGWAGCRGPIPASAPDVAGGGSPSIHPNGVALIPGSAATLRFYSDVSVDAPGARVLNYGQALSVVGISCTTDPSADVECASGSHGFVVSSGSYRLR